VRARGHLRELVADGGDDVHEQVGALAVRQAADHNHGDGRGVPLRGVGEEDGGVDGVGDDGHLVGRAPERSTVFSLLVNDTQIECCTAAMENCRICTPARPTPDPHSKPREGTGKESHPKFRTPQPTQHQVKRREGVTAGSGS